MYGYALLLVPPVKNDARLGWNTRSLPQIPRRSFLATISAGALLSQQAFAAEEEKATLESRAKAALARGLEWLFKQQADDGAWHSQTYGALRQGAALTCLVLYALGHLPRDSQKKFDDVARKGFRYLEPGLAKRSYVAGPDGSLDYPTYATALLVTASRRFEFGLKADVRNKLIDWIASGQLHETREFTADSVHYGGWDLMGASQVIGLTSDTTVSCSCFALEAIHDVKTPAIAKTLARARGWALRCQDLTGDGGFWFSPDATSINHKAGYVKNDATQPRTYGSSTSDGLRCLLYTGADAPAKNVAAGVKWFVDHAEMKYVPGFDEPEDINGWGMGLRFYYYQSLAKLLGALPKEVAAQRRTAILEQLLALQLPDGRWQNESSRMREDDPLIATCLAIIALV